MAEWKLDTRTTPEKVRDKRNKKNQKIKLKKAESEAEALEQIQTEEFYNAAVSYYNWREGTDEYSSYSHADILDKFYTDRSWRNNNTISMGKDMYTAINTDDPDQLNNFAYISQTYEALPSFWNDPNRTFGGWLIDNGGAMLADPVNLIGFGVGGQAAKQAYKQTLKEALKGKVAKEINDRVLKEAQKQAQQEALGQAIKKGALYEGFIGAGVTGVQDTMLQTTAIQTGVQEDFSLKQLGLSTAAGFGFGTVFGGSFAYGGFKLTNRAMKNRAIKQLEDLHNYGRDDITGTRLFTDLADKKEKKFYYKNLKKEEIDKIEQDSILKGKDLDEKIQNLRNEVRVSGRGRPPKEKLNYDKLDERGNTGAVKYIQIIARENAKEIGTETITFDEMKVIAEKFGADPKKLMKLAKSKAKEDKELFGLMIAHKDLLLKQGDDQMKLANDFFREGITEAEKQSIRVEFKKRAQVALELIKVQKELQENYARATTAGRVKGDAERATELKMLPEDPEMKKLMETDIDAYIKAVALLDDPNQAILALQNVRKVNKWDLAAEYVNNNLLSSPDTHILNIISGLTQTQWKPFVMLLRAANLSFRDFQRSKIVAREAFQTYIYQYVYTGYALRRAMKAFYMGRPLLDSANLKYDNNIRQGQLQRWINETGKILTEPLGIFGTGIQRGIINPIAQITTAPLRVLSAGDEFLKQMMFKGRMAAEINSRIYKETPDIGVFSNRQQYVKRFRELEKDYISETGAAIDSGDKIENILNSPLQYAREGSYTQSARSFNPVTKTYEGGVTGAVLSFTNRHKWLRVFGLHFINTPSNLLRWNFQHLPFLGRFQFQMRHMLAKGADGKYLNPEAAAEANARIQAGWLLWSAAMLMAINGRITGGGSRDWKENEERKKNTGWQEYSLKMEDGRHISLNRLDPIFMPFMIAADMVDAIGDFLKHNEDLPTEVENQYTELAMGVVASMTRNLTSKFYTRNILETANFLFSDDFMRSRAPDRIGSSVLARAIYKVTPLSGGLRYSSRISDDHQRQLFTFSDRLRQLNPFSDKDRTMPKRNMFGQKIDRQNGWLFGLGGKTGLWSSPFAMTQWKDTATAEFFKGRDFEYKAPPKVDRRTALDLRTIKDDKGQTAYDYMLERKQHQTFTHRGKTYKLQQYIEALIADKNSELYRMPDGVVAGKDYQQSFILRIIHAAEKGAYADMWNKYPILAETLEERGVFIQEKFDAVGNASSYDSILETIINK